MSVLKIPPKLPENSTDLRYGTNSDASMRLSGTVIKYENIPIFVKGVSEEDTMLRAWDMLEEGQLFLIHYNDVRLDVSSQPLGYVYDPDVFDAPCFLTRAPRRLQKQGIDPTRLIIYRKGRYSGLGIGPGHGRAIIALGKTLRNEYPSIQSLEAPQGALSRSLAFYTTKDKKLRSLFYKNSSVGLVSLSDRAIYIPKTVPGEIHTKISNYINKQGGSYELAVV